MTKQSYERKKLKEERRQPWPSSKKMHYLRLSKGRRKPTASELQLAAMQTANYASALGLAPVRPSTMGSTMSRSENRAKEAFGGSSVKKLQPMSRQKIGPTGLKPPPSANHFNKGTTPLEVKQKFNHIKVRSKIFTTMSPEAYRQELQSNIFQPSQNMIRPSE